ncbi:MAG: prepilin-type N-terminal cleavage/methylation domain-containing protein [Candidatus Tumulicola sp.]
MRERGFTLVETIVSIAIAAVLLAAGGMWMLGMHPGALAQSADDYDAALASARAIAATSGDGATLVFVPRTDAVRTLSGFLLRVYAGRPAPGQAVRPTTAMPVVSDATVAEKTLGHPPFAIFIGASGHVSGASAYPHVGAHGSLVFPTIPTEPACPKGGFVLTFTGPQSAVATRRLPCAPPAAGVPGLPNPSPTPNLPIVTPKALLYHWPADAEQTFVATEWGYAHWFVTTTGFACGAGIAVYPDVLPSPYSPAYSQAEADASPSPPPATPYSYPNSHGGSTNDAPAPFPLDPAVEGLCTASVADDYGQAAHAGVQVMGWLTATYNAREFTHLSKPALALPSSAFPGKGAAVTIGLSKTYDAEPLKPSVAFDAACVPYLTFSVVPGNTPPSPSRSPATASVTLTLVTMPASKVECGGTIYDQYPGSQTGEGVPFNATLGAPPCANSRNTWLGPNDGACYDLYSIGTGTTENGGWIEESELGLYVPHGTTGDELYAWIVGDGSCYVQNLIGTDFAAWSVLIGNGDPTPPPVATPQPIGNPAGFGLGYVPDTVAVTSAPDPKPTVPPPFACKTPPTRSPRPE